MSSAVVKICKKHGELKEDQVKSEINRSGYVNYRCHQCKIDKDRRWKERNKEAHNASASIARNQARKEYREGLTDVEPKANVWAREYKSLYPEKHKEWARIGRERLGPIRNLKEITRVRGLTLEEYYVIEGRQDGKCAICGQPETRKSRTSGNICRLALDHNHSTGKIRKLLCHACNQVIGHSRESIEVLKATISYLEEHKE